MKVALIGNPNVGKSLIFSQLTGIGVEISNFPGTTIGISSGGVCYQREIVELIDFPGIYSLDGTTEEETSVRHYMQEGNIDVIVPVLNASNLERNLYLLLQIAEYQMSGVVVINMVDESEKAGIEIDFAHLSDIIGCTVIAAAASEGRNVGDIIPCALSDARKMNYEVPYMQHIEAAIRSLVKIHGCSRREALDALQMLGSDADLLDSASTLAEEIEEEHQMSVHQIIATNRHNAAAKIADEITVFKDHNPDDRIFYWFISGRDNCRTL